MDKMSNWEPTKLPRLELPSLTLPDVDFEAIQNDIREHEYEIHGYAHVMHEQLMLQIRQFEKKLQPNEEIACYLASFGTRVLISIDNVGYHNPFFITFTGVNADTGQKVLDYNINPQARWL